MTSFKPLIWDGVDGVTIGGVAVNALAFSGTNIVFSRLTDHGEEERKSHDLALEKH